MRRLAVILTAIVLLSAAPASVWAALFVPAGVAPGSQYQLAFFTSQGDETKSGDISYYNSFVNAAADAVGIGPNSPGGIGWHAVVSTRNVNAIDNAPVTAPLFNMHGDIVATSSADLWDGTIQNPIQYEESGAINTDPSRYVWTGTAPWGGGVDYYGVGFFIEDRYTFMGSPSATDGGWVDAGYSFIGWGRSYYAISDPITAPSAVPEPSTLLVWSGLVLQRPAS